MVSVPGVVFSKTQTEQVEVAMGAVCYRKEPAAKRKKIINFPGREERVQRTSWRRWHWAWPLAVIIPPEVAPAVSVARSEALQQARGTVTVISCTLSTGPSSS